MANASSAGIGQNLTARQTSFVHPTYQLLRPVWEKLRHVRYGEGGFLDGSYLVGHPREYIQRRETRTEGGKTITEMVSTGAKTKKFKARIKLANYENFAGRIIKTMRAALCREQPIRRVGEEEEKGDNKEQSPLEDWWENVDGNGMAIDDFMAFCWGLAGTFGHVHLYMDLPRGTPAETAADQTQPFIRVYTPLDAWDWMVDDMGALQAIKFAEVAPRTSIKEAWRPEMRVRLVTAEKWELYNQNGTLIEQGKHAFGRLPVVTLYAERKEMDPNTGGSVLGDPNLYIDLYNLISELRELLRNQTFGIMNVPLGTGDQAASVEDAQLMMGTTVGTDSVLFSPAPASYISPAADNVEAYHAEIQRKLRTIFRLIGIVWEADSKDAEAEGSLKIKREDLNQQLSAYADELERADYELAELFYRATEGPDKGETALEDEEVTIKYPDTFDVSPFEALIEEAQAARDLGMGPTFLKEQRKMLLTKFTGMADLPQNKIDQIVEEIDSAPDDLTPAQQAEQRLDLTMQAMKMGKPKEPTSPMKETKPKAVA